MDGFYRNHAIQGFQVLAGTEYVHSLFFGNGGVFFPFYFLFLRLIPL